MVGLNFASEKEASQFANAVEAKLQERTERRMSMCVCVFCAGWCMLRNEACPCNCSTFTVL